jgi:hypothetical protein
MLGCIIHKILFIIFELTIDFIYCFKKLEAKIFLEGGHYEKYTVYQVEYFQLSLEII